MDRYTGFKEYHASLHFVSKMEGSMYEEDDNDFLVEDLDDDPIWIEADIFLLHPNELEKCLEMKRQNKSEDEETWVWPNVPESFYHGDKMSAMILLIQHPR